MDPRAHGPENEQVAARLRIVEEHVRRENEHDRAGIMATFADEAKYDDASWAEQRLGRDAVEQYYRDLLAALPDLHIDVRDSLVTEDAVVLEVLISGMQAGTWNKKRGQNKKRDKKRGHSSFLLPNEQGPR